MSENNGMHHAPGNSSGPGVERGQTSRRNPAAEVGNENGPAANMRVPAAPCGAEIDTTTGSAGPRAYGEKRGGVDDCKE